MKNYNFLLAAIVIIITLIMSIITTINKLLELDPFFIVWAFITFLTMYSFAKYINSRNKRYNGKLTLNLSKPANGEKLNGNGNLDLSKIQIVEMLATGLKSDTHEWHFIEESKDKYSVFVYPKNQRTGIWMKKTSEEKVKKLLSQGKVKNFSFVNSVLEKL